MAQTVVGLFDNFQDAQDVVRDLESAGFTHDAISLVANDASGQYSQQHGGHDKMNDTPAEKAGSGAVAGTATGAGLGLLAGLAALAIPGVGPLIAAGPLAASLGVGAATVAGATALGAGIGAASGALVGPLVDAGIPRPEAEVYNEGVRRGGALVTVRTNDRSDAEEAADIMSQHRVVDIDQRGEDFRSSGWTHSDNAEPYTADQINTFSSSNTSFTPSSQTDVSSQTNVSSGTTNRITNAGDEAVLPVVEEELQVGKRQVERGAMRVRTYVSERPIEENVRLRDETVRVERRPVSRDVSAADVDAFRDQTIEVTETDEEAVVAKRARVIEEVVVRKDVEERTETIHDTVRRQDVDVEENVTGVSDTRAVGSAEFSSYDSDFRNHFQTNYANSGMDYDSYGPVYRYGYNLADHDQYRNAEWNTVENDARTRWEERNPGTWDQYKEGIRYAWDRARGRR